MKINRKLHQQIRLQNFLFTLLFLVLVGLLAWLSERYSTGWDWTAEGRHSLSESSQKVLVLMEDPLTITAYAHEDNELRGRIKELVIPYQRHKADLELTFVNPDLHPDRVRELGITMDGELTLEYGQRTEKVHDLSEQALTNALARLAKSQELAILFLEGHGERSPLRDANFDLGQFGHTLENQGFQVHGWNLAKQPDLPANTSVLIIASPQVPYLPGEVETIRRFVDDGGNLLWFAEPGNLKGLESLAETLGVTFLPGVVVDPSGRALGIQDPTFALVAEYPLTPITRNFQNLTLFPRARALETKDSGQFSAGVFLQTLPRTWNETGPLEGEITFDPDQGEQEGPLPLGVTLTRPMPGDGEDGDSDSRQSTNQRIVVIGDGDFLSNTYLGNGGNLDLGLNIVQWLTHNDRFIDIPPKTAPDTRLTLSSTALALIGFGFMIVLPLILFGGGMFIWWRRRRA
ncbi:GldG family protein [Methylohalobius crimeensis]|uniref:GldG family protein n=1 Tax=Methylohalobius crimeensis TaxID=244365 RepID=UPI0003B45D17|nr:GldG family protein [Methylohalobius crimeensis]